jgi:hypothetical protein
MIVAWHEVPMEFGHLHKIASGDLRREEANPEEYTGLSPGLNGAKIRSVRELCPKSNGCRIKPQVGT